MPTAPKRLGAPASGAKRMEYRPAAHKRGYDYIWSKVAKRARARDCNLCQPCRRAGRTVVCDLVDHTIPVHVRTDWRLNLANTECQCYSCHRIKTAKDNALYGSREEKPNSFHISNRAKAELMQHPPKQSRRVVVYGPQCAGKTTYVQEMFSVGDLVWDYDAIATQLTGNAQHESAAWIIPVMEQMRTAFMDKAAKECSGTVWMIVCKTDMAIRCAKQMDAELVRIAPDVETCKQRMRERSVGHEDVCIAGIERWYREDANG